MKPHQPKDCSKTLRLLDDFIAGELSVESNREILMHLELCDACRVEHEQREEMRRRLREAWNAQRSPEGLGERIMQGIEPAVDYSRHLRRAAGFAIALVALYALIQFFPVSVQAIDHYYQALHDHFDCQEIYQTQRPMPVPPESPVWKRALEGLPGEPYLSIAHYCTAEGVDFIHYKFMRPDGSKHFSLVMETRREWERLADRSEISRASVDSLPVGVIDHANASLVSFETERHFIYLVCQDRDRQAALRLASQFLPHLKDAI